MFLHLKENCNPPTWIFIQYVTLEQNSLNVSSLEQKPAEEGSQLSQKET